MLYKWSGYAIDTGKNVYRRKMVSKLSDKGCKITLDVKKTSVLIQFRV